MVIIIITTTNKYKLLSNIKINSYQVKGQFFKRFVFVLFLCGECFLHHIPRRPTSAVRRSSRKASVVLESPLPYPMTEVHPGVTRVIHRAGRYHASHHSTQYEAEHRSSLIGTIPVVPVSPVPNHLQWAHLTKMWPQRPLGDDCRASGLYCVSFATSFEDRPFPDHALQTPSRA